MAVEYYSNLAKFYFGINREMVLGRKWTSMDMGMYQVTWETWGAWGPVGYTPSKLTQLINQSIDPYELERTIVRLKRVTSLKSSSDVYTVAMQFGQHTAGKVISPLRYKLGACLSTVIFRVYKGRHYSPLVIWRTTEVTRRLVADLVLLDNLWRWTGMTAPDVRFFFGSKWIANFNLQVLGQLAPVLEKQAKKSWQHLFFPKKIPPKYRARKIAWDVAKNIKHPMFNMHGLLWGGNYKPDFPKVRLKDVLPKAKS